MFPKCSSGTRSAHRPRLPPIIEGEDETSSACLVLNGCGRTRETQSMAFFSNPGTEALYSGDEITNASQRLILSHRANAPAGSPSESSRSPSYSGMSKSRILARSTSAPVSTIMFDAREASCALVDPARSAAPNTRTRTGAG